MPPPYRVGVGVAYRGLVLTGDRNAPGRADYTGAFLPESQAFVRSRAVLGDQTGVWRFNVGIPLWLRRGALERLELEAEVGYDWVAVFCHGWADGTQLGLGKGNVDRLAKALVRADCRLVVLYCCSTGSSRRRGAVGGDGGYADALRDAVYRLDPDSELRVVAHSTAAHCTRNPNVRVFEGPDPQKRGGVPWFAPEDPDRGRWAKALRGPLRFEFPWAKDLGELRAVLPQVSG